MDRTTAIALSMSSLGLYLMTRSYEAFKQEGDDIWTALKGYDPIVQKNAKTWGLPANLIKAVIWVESNGVMNATRFEESVQEYSYGLMQVLWTTALEMGFTGERKDLLQASPNIFWGSKYLSQQLRRYNGNVSSAVAAYNAGSVFMEGGKYVNQGYVDKVLKIYRSLNI